MWTNDKHKSRGSYLLWQLCACLQFTQDKSLWASSLGDSGSGAEKGRRACSYVSGIWISPPIPLWLPGHWLSFHISANQCKVEMTANVNKHWKKHMTSLLMSSSPVSSLHQLFQRRYSNSRDVVGSSPSCILPPLPELPGELAHRLDKC